MKTSFIKIAVRILLVSLYAISIPYILKKTMTDDVVFSPPVPLWILVVIYLMFFNLNSEGNFYFDKYLNKKLPWFYFPKKRLVIQSIFLIAWSFITLGIPFTIWYYINGRSLVYPPFSVFAFIFSIILLSAFIGISVAVNFLKQWKSSLLDVELYKREKLLSDYKVLQNQIDPHFLFNSFNVLIPLIKHDPNTAESFTRKLSLVYRYVLQSKNHDLITLNKELEFIHSFIYLHQIRFGDALQIKIDVKADSMKRYLPPLTLQILVENAIKHNVMNEENHLQIYIYTLEIETLVVKNSLNPKQTFNSTKTGLPNLKARYQLLKDNGIKIDKSKTEFTVTIPLLEEQK
jgi:two-component system LytT family sensor kinase